MKHKRDRKKYHACTARKLLIRNMTASICGFDCKNSYNLSVFAIYFEN